MGVLTGVQAQETNERPLVPDDGSTAHVTPSPAEDSLASIPSNNNSHERLREALRRDAKVLSPEETRDLKDSMSYLLSTRSAGILESYSLNGKRAILADLMNPSDAGFTPSPELQKAMNLILGNQPDAPFDRRSISHLHQKAFSGLQNVVDPSIDPRPDAIAEANRALSQKFAVLQGQAEVTMNGRTYLGPKEEMRLLTESPLEKKVRFLERVKEPLTNYLEAELEQSQRVVATTGDDLVRITEENRIPKITKILDQIDKWNPKENPQKLVDLVHKINMAFPEQPQFRPKSVEGLMEDKSFRQAIMFRTES
jgi:hypothetical protein